MKSIVIEFKGITTNESKAFFPKYTYWGYVGGKTTEIDNLIAQGHTILGGFICGGPHNDASMAGKAVNNLKFLIKVPKAVTFGQISTKITAIKLC